MITDIILTVGFEDASLSEGIGGRSSPGGNIFLQGKDCLLHQELLWRFPKKEKRRRGRLVTVFWAVELVKGVVYSLYTPRVHTGFA